jgi:hypothetical protein
MEKLNQKLNQNYNKNKNKNKKKITRKNSTLNYRCMFQPRYLNIKYMIFFRMMNRL